MIKKYMVGLYSALILVLCAWGIDHVLARFRPHAFSDDSLFALSVVVALVIWLPGNYALTLQWGVLRPN
jgi:hypothetical protein